MSLTPGEFARVLRKLAESKQELAEDLAEEAQRLIQRGFDTEIDPRGVGWAPRLPYSKRTNPLLRATRTLEGSFQEPAAVRSTNEGFEIREEKAPYGAFHQSGTYALPRRRMFPGNGEGLGAWKEPIEKVTENFIRRKLGLDAK